MTKCRHRLSHPCQIFTGFNKGVSRIYFPEIPKLLQSSSLNAGLPCWESDLMCWTRRRHNKGFGPPHKNLSEAMPQQQELTGPSYTNPATIWKPSVTKLCDVIWIRTKVIQQYAKLSEFASFSTNCSNAWIFLVSQKSSNNFKTSLNELTNENYKKMSSAVCIKMHFECSVDF